MKFTNILAGGLCLAGIPLVASSPLPPADEKKADVASGNATESQFVDVYVKAYERMEQQVTVLNDEMWLWDGRQPSLDRRIGAPARLVIDELREQVAGIRLGKGAIGNDIERLDEYIKHGAGAWKMVLRALVGHRAEIVRFEWDGEAHALLSELKELARILNQLTQDSCDQPTQDSCNMSYCRYRMEEFKAEYDELFDDALKAYPPKN